MASLEPILDVILSHEGGYRLTDHTNDRGGRTYAGISWRANKSWAGWDLIDNGEVDSEALRGLVAQRYRERYWTPIRGDEIPSHELAMSLMSCAVLSGTHVAIKLCQMVLGLKADGVFGPRTMEAVVQIQPHTLEEALFDARFALARIARYSELVRRYPKQMAHFRGWVNRAGEDSK